MESDPTIEANMSRSARHALAEFRPHLQDRMELQVLSRDDKPSAFTDIPIEFTLSELKSLEDDILERLLDPSCTSKHERSGLVGAMTAITYALQKLEGE